MADLENGNPTPLPPEAAEPPPAEAAAMAEELVEPPPPPPSATVTETETPHSPPQESAPTPAPAGPTQEPVIEPENPKPIGAKKVPESLVSFKEESNLVKDLSDIEKRALDELKHLLQESLNNHEFAAAEPAAAGDAAAESTEITSLPEEISIWGVPFFKDERTDVILQKFLRARDFKVREALTMLKNTMAWRKSFGIDALVEEIRGDDLEKVVFMHGFDKEGHPVCYNVYGEFQNKELYQLLQDNYPEFVTKQVLLMLICANCVN